MEPFITRKRLDKAKCLILNLIRLKFVNKTSIPNAVESPAYISSTARVALYLLKTLDIL